MSGFVIRHSLHLVTVLGIGVAIYVGTNWVEMPVVQRIVGLSFVALIAHVWEEFRFPGGFAEMVTARLNFALADPQVAKLIVVAYILYLAFVPLFFPGVIWLSMAAMLLGVLEPVFHVAAIKLFHQKNFYSPGLITAAGLLLPVGAYGIVYIVQHHLMKPWEYALSLLYMVIGLAIAQGTVVRMSGLAYIDFLKRMRSTLFETNQR
jgi:Protein of unknown function with HXXEE motif